MAVDLHRCCLASWNCGDAEHIREMAGTAVTLLIPDHDACSPHFDVTLLADRQINLSEVVNGQVFCNFSSVASSGIRAK